MKHNVAVIIIEHTISIIEHKNTVVVRTCVWVPPVWYCWWYWWWGRSDEEAISIPVCWPFNDGHANNCLPESIRCVILRLGSQCLGRRRGLRRIHARHEDHKPQSTPRPCVPGPNNLQGQKGYVSTYPSQSCKTQDMKLIYRDIQDKLWHAT